MIKLVYAITIFCLLLSIIKNLIKFSLIYQDFKPTTHTYISKVKEKNKEIYFIIPVYNEVKNIEKAIDYYKKFSQLNVQVVFVTTQKEKDSKTYNKLINSKEKYFTVIDYPKQDGIIAHQLNYAISKLPEEVIICIYNVDSKPDINVVSYCNEYKTAGDNNLFQTPYYSNTTKQKGIMKSAVYWQNRWSILTEYYMYKKFKKGKFVYLIGHGLILDKDIWRKCNYFSEKYLTEDNILGYMACVNAININVVPFFEEADFTIKTKIYIKQQSTWFNGPLYAFHYYKTNIHNFRSLILSLKNFKYAVSWVCLPLLVTLSIFISIFKLQLIILIILICLLDIYVTLLNMISHHLLKKKKLINEKYEIHLIFDILFYLMRSIGPLLTIFKIIIRKNNFERRYATEK